LNIATKTARISAPQKTAIVPVIHHNLTSFS